MAWQVQVALFIASAAISYQQQKKAERLQREAENKAKGILIPREGSAEQIPVIYGTRRVAGIRVHMESQDIAGGLPNEKLYLVYVLCEGEVEGAGDLFVDGTPVADTDYDPYISYTVQNGTEAQTPPSWFTDGSTSWSAEHQLKGLAVAYVALTMPSRSDKNPFSGSIPALTWLVRGKKVYDPRFGTTGFSSNPALCLRDYLTNTIYGKGLSASLVNDHTIIDAAYYYESAREVYDSLVVELDPPDSIYIHHQGEDDEAWYMVWEDEKYQSSLYNGLELVQDGIAYTVIGVGYNHVYSENGNVTSYGTRLGFYQGGTPPNTPNLTGKLTRTLDEPLYACNAYLSTDQTILENLKELLVAGRASLPYVSGQYSLLPDILESSFGDDGFADQSVDEVIDDGLTTEASSETIDEGETDELAYTLELNEDHILKQSGIKLSGGNKSDRYNQVNITYASSKNDYDSDTYVWPVPGSSEETAFLAEDNDEVLSLNMQVEALTEESQVAQLAKAICLQSRSNIRIEVACQPIANKLQPGSTLLLTYSSFGWVQKPFKVLSTRLIEDGSVAIGAKEITTSMYDVPDNLVPKAQTEYTELPNPYSPTPPTNLQLTSNASYASDGHVQASITASWTASTNQFVRKYQVQWKKAADSAYTIFETDGVEVVIAGLEDNTAYDVRVRAISAGGVGYSSYLGGSVVLAIDHTLVLPVDSESAVYRRWYTKDLSPVSPDAIDFANEGFNAYVLYDNGGTATVVEYVLDRPYDVSSSTGNTSFTDASFSATRGIKINPDGTKIHAVDGVNVYEVTMSTAFDLSTANFTSSAVVPVSAVYAINSVDYNSDGSKMYFLEEGNFKSPAAVDAVVHQTSLSTAYTISSISDDGVSGALSGANREALDLEFSRDGLRLVVAEKIVAAGDFPGAATVYELSSAYDLSTLSLKLSSTFLQDSIKVPTSSTIESVALSDDDKRLILVQNNLVVSFYVGAV